MTRRKGRRRGGDAEPSLSRGRVGAQATPSDRELTKAENLVTYIPAEPGQRIVFAGLQPRPSLSHIEYWRDVPVVPAPPSADVRVAARSGFGTIGEKCLINANHFLVALGQNDPHQYDVTISPEVTSRTKCREIMEKLSFDYLDSHLGNLHLAFDGKKSAFAAGLLPFESKEFAVKITEQNGQEQVFQVTIKFAAKKDLYYLRQFLCGRQHDSPQDIIQALDLVLRESISSRYAVVGRSLFSKEFGNFDSMNGIVYCKGFYQSLRPTQMGLSLNLDMSAKAFYEPSFVSDFIGSFLKKDLFGPLTDQERIKVETALRGVRVNVTQQNYMRSYMVQELTVQPISQLTFPDKTGAIISVSQYFIDRYNLNLRYPMLPAIQAGTDAKPIYLPTEICYLAEGQRYTPKLSGKQVRKLLKATCQRPRDRENNILMTMKSTNYNEKHVNIDFGMRVSQQLTSIEARVLPPPLLRYCDSVQVNPATGQWSMTDLKVIDGGTIYHWAIANFSMQKEDAVMCFCNELVQTCQNKGIFIKSEPLIPMVSAPPHNIEEALADIKAQCTVKLEGRCFNAQLQLLFVILPEAKGTYGRIKRLCETKFGFVSQCCKPTDLLKRSEQYFVNVAMKINVKVGGTNSVLSDGSLPYISDRPTIIFGADVSHPSPGEDSLSPSIAAVVASMDWPHMTQYKALVSAQPHRQEIIQDLYHNRDNTHGGTIRELLKSFYMTHGFKPHRIIFYRDGVSEGQFNEVLLSEVNNIRKACISLEEDYMPPVTFIVVKKRHHTRFFPDKHAGSNSTDNGGNVPPGTVVDTQICHPTGFDFYLCSHAGIKGTSRPTRYHVLYDENKFTANDLQMLTNSLCYTYARCTRSVSIVPPAYYAHLAAYRVRSYLEGAESNSDICDSCGRRAAGDRVAEVGPIPVIHDYVNSQMFYC